MSHAHPLVILRRKLSASVQQCPRPTKNVSHSKDLFALKGNAPRLLHGAGAPHVGSRRPTPAGTAIALKELDHHRLRRGDRSRLWGIVVPPVDAHYDYAVRTASSGYR